MAKGNKAALANLQEGFKIIKNKKNWIQGYLNDLEATGAEEGEPSKFCAVGVTEFVDGKGEDRALEYLDQATEELFGSKQDWFSVVDANDHGTRKTAHARVVRVFKRAIQLAKGA